VFYTNEVQYHRPRFLIPHLDRPFSLIPSSVMFNNIKKQARLARLASNDYSNLYQHVFRSFDHHIRQHFIFARIIQQPWSDKFHSKGNGTSLTVSLPAFPKALKKFAYWASKLLPRTLLLFHQRAVKSLHLAPTLS
jgi:hypothetical protein